MDLSARCKSILNALEDGRQLNIPPFGKLAMTDGGDIGFVVEQNGIDVVSVGGLSEISINGFLRAIARISEDDMAIIVGNNVIQRIRQNGLN